MSSFHGKVAIITGATSGIGKAVAIALSKKGAVVVVVGRRVDEGRAVVDQIVQAGGVASFYKADVSKEGEIEAMVTFTVEKYGRLDLAFNNAGVFSRGPTTDITEADYLHVFNLNVWGVLASMKHEIRAMLKNGGGSIVNCSSVVGHRGLPELQIYSASKHAVEGLTKSVAKEYAKQGIRVNSVAPGPTLTEILAKVPEEVVNGLKSTVPQGRIADPEEIVPAVLHLLDPASSFTTGISIAVDGGILA